MPAVEIPESLFKRLQRLAIPLVDTTVTVIERLVDEAELATHHKGSVHHSHSGGNSRSVNRDPEPSEFVPDTPPDLRHTRVLSARFASRTASGWNDLVHAAHAEALSQLRSLDVLRGVTKSNFITGRASSEDTKRGFHHVPEINISIQNVGAEQAWVNSLRLARHLGTEIRVTFEWMRKNDAAQPGKTGTLSWRP